MIAAAQATGEKVLEQSGETAFFGGGIP
jgi:hypothetical protein